MPQLGHRLRSRVVAPGDALSAAIAESEVIASAEVLALGAEHLHAIGVVESAWYVGRDGPNGCRGEGGGPGIAGSRLGWGENRREKQRCPGGTGCRAGKGRAAVWTSQAG